MARYGKRALPAHCFATKDHKELKENFLVISVFFCGKKPFGSATKERKELKENAL
jgi:hypothetical protein